MPNRPAFRVTACPLALVARPLLLACLLQLFQLQRLTAETHFDYKYEDYKEDDGRMRIQTHSALFELDLDPKLSLKGEYVYDGISGATPPGTYNNGQGFNAAGGNTSDPAVSIQDIRRAGSVSPTLKLGRYSATPQLSYSEESDYISKGISLNQSVEFNEKNTLISLGVSRDFDVSLGTAKHPKSHASNADDLNKESQDYLVGVTQVLDPQTTLSAAFTFGYSRGYLADPYKAISYEWIDLFDGSLNPGPRSGRDVRPSSKTRQVLHTELIHRFIKADASLALSYRFHHDSYDIISHTVSGAWNQKLGRLFVLTPSVRYYTQGAANFYSPSFMTSADSNDPNANNVLTGFEQDALHSSDHRLSKMETFTYGAQLAATLHDHLWLDFAYKRYVMQGLDGVTPAEVYPSADVFTIGLRLWY